MGNYLNIESRLEYLRQWHLGERTRRKARLIRLLGGVCHKCGEACQNDSTTHFHHVRAEEKLFNIGRNIMYSWDAVTREANKCVLMCAQCHRAEHKRLTL